MEFVQTQNYSKQPLKKNLSNFSEKEWTNFLQSRVHPKLEDILQCWFWFPIMPDQWVRENLIEQNHALSKPELWDSERDVSQWGAFHARPWDKLACWEWGILKKKSDELRGKSKMEKAVEIYIMWW